MDILEGPFREDIGVPLPCVETVRTLHSVPWDTLVAQTMLYIDLFIFHINRYPVYFIPVLGHLAFMYFCFSCCLLKP